MIILNQGTIQIGHLITNVDNPRKISKDKLDKLKTSIKEFPEMLTLRPIVVDEQMVVLGGNMRLFALAEMGVDEVNYIQVGDLSPEQKKEFIIKDNLGYGEWEWDTLLTQWDTDLLLDWGLDIPEFALEESEDKVVEAHKKLQDTFIVPPFSILDTRQGYWMDRKKHWRTLIGDDGESREQLLDEGGIVSTLNNGTSLFDPVLMELVVRWFNIEGGNICDPFAGGYEKAFVAHKLGSYYTGIELRQEQVNINLDRITIDMGKYVCDDGQNVGNHIPLNSQDLLFSCPPYFDLEIYSDLPNDASNQGTYEDFLHILDVAFTDAINCLKDNRFAVIVVGDIRMPDGFYYDFITDIKNIFINNGMGLYNEMILVEPIGTLPQRVARYMVNRKIGKCHQNVLVFYKGDTNQIKTLYPKIDIDASTNV